MKNMAPLPAEETAKRARLLIERLRSGDHRPFEFPPYQETQTRLPLGEAA